jgi:hypothetical protein
MTNKITNMKAAETPQSVASIPGNSAPSSRRRHFWLPSAAVLLVAAAPAVQAEAGNPLNDTFSVSLGGFLLNTKTNLRVDGESIQGNEFDTERDLGLNDSDRFRVDGYWRMTPRQKIRVMYFSTDNSATKTLDRDIEIGDNLYPIDLEITAGMKTTVTAISYEFDFMRSDNYELGVTGGIHNLKFDFHIEGSGNGQNIAAETSSEANGPLPVIGLHGVWRINDKFYFDAGAQFFKISVDPYDGRVSNYDASFVWQATKHFGFGAGWNSFVTKLDVNGDKFDGSLRWSYGGARIYVIASF